MEEKNIGKGKMEKINSQKIRKVSGGFVAFWCPGCNDIHLVGIEPPATPIWSWNNNSVSPTFNPSIQIKQVTHFPPVTSENLEQWKKQPWEQVPVVKICHSFIIDGNIRFLEDSTHHLSGHTAQLASFPKPN